MSNSGEAITLRMLKHNAWAVGVLLDLCRDLDRDQLTQPFEIGTGNVHDTLRHIISAMWRWADRIADKPLRPSINDRGYCTIEELSQYLEQAAEDLENACREVIANDRLEEMMEFRMPGMEEPIRFTRGTAIVHVITHGAHHRAQVLNMCRRLGVTVLPDIDAIEWELESRQQ